MLMAGPAATVPVRGTASAMVPMIAMAVAIQSLARDARRAGVGRVGTHEDPSQNVMWYLGSPAGLRGQAPWLCVPGSLRVCLDRGASSSLKSNVASEGLRLAKGPYLAMTALAVAPTGSFQVVVVLAAPDPY
jgi:hypothetical protein